MEFDDYIEPFAADVKRLEQAFILHDIKKENKFPAIIFCI